MPRHKVKRKQKAPVKMLRTTVARKIFTQAEMDNALARATADFHNKHQDVFAQAASYDYVKAERDKLATERRGLLTRLCQQDQFIATIVFKGKLEPRQFSINQFEPQLTTGNIVVTVPTWTRFFKWGRK